MFDNSIRFITFKTTWNHYQPISHPSLQPKCVPTRQPIKFPSFQPVPNPTTEPSNQPYTFPTYQPVALHPTKPSTKLSPSPSYQTPCSQSYHLLHNLLLYRTPNHLHNQYITRAKSHRCNLRAFRQISCSGDHRHSLRYNHCLSNTFFKYN